MIELLRKLLAPKKQQETAVPEPASTKPELDQEKVLRAELSRRTESLAKMLDDYRAQDHILRR